MAEYWKSTPKYWCKHCSTYVKDTRFERTQHEATGKHQGNLKRFLRGIQNDHEKNEREKQRAKSEVERLNRVVQGNPIASAPGTMQCSSRTTTSISPPITTADRKRQMAQLAEMGVAVPHDFRREMAMAGEWQVISQTPVQQSESVEMDSSLSVGVRKRKVDDHEEEDEACHTGKRRAWGSTIKDYPSDSKQDVDALLASSIQLKAEEPLPLVKVEPINQQSNATQECCDATDPADKILVKKEKSPEKCPAPGQVTDNPDSFSNDAPAPSEVIFKKRKSRLSRQN